MTVPAPDTASAIDLATPPPSPPPSADPTSLTSLARSLDSAPGASIPSFLNTLLAPLLPPSLPSSSSASKAPIPFRPDLGALDKTLNELHTRLSLLAQDTSNALEQNIHDVARTVPRLTYDLQFMRESAGSLQTSLALVQSRVSRHQAAAAGAGPSSTGGAGGGETDEARTQRALERVTHLSTLKSRMEAARDVLHEAESWSSLEGEITGYIADAAWRKAGERLKEAGRSMAVFQNTPQEYETKRSLLVSLTNELETALAAALGEALDPKNAKGSASTGPDEVVKVCADFYEIFGMISRSTEFENYYFANRRRPLVRTWEGAILLDVPSSARPDTIDAPGAAEAVRLSVFLPRFYGTLLSALQTERSQVPLIFPPETAQTVLSTFLQTTFGALSPSMQARLAEMAEHHGAEALPELIRCHKATEELALGVQSVMDKLAFNTQGGTLSGKETAVSPLGTTPPASVGLGSGSGSGASGLTPKVDPKGLPTPSKRMSLSRHYSRGASSRDDSSATSPQAWETTLFEPLLDLQTTYASLEKRYLSHQLQHDPAFTTRSARSAKDGPSRLLWERTVTAFGLADDAVSRCLAFTHGFGAAGLVEALGGFFRDFLDQNQAVTLDLVRASSRSAQASGGGRGRGQEAPDELDMAGIGLDYSTEDWSAFQLGLHVLETLKDVDGRLAAFEARLGTTLSEIAKVVRLTMADTAALPRETTLGAITLLQQSPLHSAELHALLPSSSSSSFPHLPSTQALPPARQALRAFTAQSQALLRSIILRPLLASLETYPSLPVWSAPPKPARKGELAIPHFSLGPTDTVARVSEGLLNLLRVFEAYAADGALGYSLGTLEFVDDEMLRALGPGPPSPVPPATARLSASAAVSASGGSPASGAGATSPGSSLAPLPSLPTSSASAGITSASPALSPEMILSTWISSLTLSLLSHLTSSVLPSIRALTPGPQGGAAQLESDLAYLGNAVRALDAEWEELERWREAVGCAKGLDGPSPYPGAGAGAGTGTGSGGEAEWRVKLRELRAEAGKEVEEGIWRRVGTMRGWSPTGSGGT